MATLCDREGIVRDRGDKGPWDEHRMETEEAEQGQKNMYPNIQSDPLLSMDSMAPAVVTSPAAAEGELPNRTATTTLDQRLSAVLRGLTRGFACDAADFFVLTTDSASLTLRAHYNAGGGEVAGREGDGEPRPLAGAEADVAAMAGNAIVLEDDLEVADWPVPVWCGAAICLPVAGPTTIHGTLWLYSNEPRAFAHAELELAEVVAGRLAAELELHALRSSNPRPVPTRRRRSLATTPVRSTPQVLRPSRPALEDWELAGSTEDNQAGQGYYDWQTFADGRTLVTVGAVSGNAGDPLVLLNSARVALRAHAMESQDAGELLTRVNQTLWLASPGGEGLALAVAMLENDGARATIALAGATATIRWRASTCDVLMAGSSPAGWAEQSVYVARGFDLVVRERLVLAAGCEGGLDRLAKKTAKKTLTRKLQSPTSSELREMTGKRALRLLAEASTVAGGSPPSSLVLIRRR